MQKIFEVKPKKQLMLSSAFPKKKGAYKVPMQGTILSNYFVTKEHPDKLYEIFMNELSKYHDPLLSGEETRHHIVASYYRVKPPKSSVEQRGSMNMQRQPSVSKVMAHFEDPTNKILELSFNIVKLTTNFYFAFFNKEEVR